ncbi:hypothetical protein GCM10023329_56450 [Streptomyces sanyensis]|uniref:Uncharacterized protein n=1 Tax=Streptomyces sanyensis TaxID=568869 RepID=A0ABP9BJ44_9ACTN
MLDDARHGLDRHRLGDPLADEGGQDQVGGVQPGLGDHTPHGGGGPEPPGAGTGEGSVRSHTATLRPPGAGDYRHPVGAEGTAGAAAACAPGRVRHMAAVRPQGAGRDSPDTAYGRTVRTIHTADS